MLFSRSSFGERWFSSTWILSLFCAALLGTAVFAQRRGTDRSREARLAMVRNYLEREGIDNERVLESMRSVPRHEFVPTNMRRRAYDDAAMAIGYKQTISPPFIVAYMTQSLDPQPTDRVLEIGTGSGYQAAVLSSLVAEVYSIEIVEPLGRAAAQRLRRLGYDNVHTKVGDGYLGWPDKAPFDKIIVTCSPEDIPQPLVDQLKEGGKMIIPLGERYQQVFHLLEKRDGQLVVKKLIPTLFVPMTGISETQRDVQPDPAHPRIINGGFELDENQDSRADNWHYQRQTTRMTGDAPEGEFFLRLVNEEPGRLSQLLQGMPLDGRVIRALRLRAQVRVESIRGPNRASELPNLSIHFFDSVRRNIGVGTLGPWYRPCEWRELSTVIRVPSKTREAIVCINMSSATGQFDIDDVQLTPLASSP